MTKLWKRVTGKRTAEINVITFPNGRKQFYEIVLTRYNSRSGELRARRLVESSFERGRTMAMNWLDSRT